MTVLKIGTRKILTYKKINEIERVICSLLKVSKKISNESVTWYNVNDSDYCDAFGMTRTLVILGYLKDNLERQDYFQKLCDKVLIDIAREKLTGIYNV